MKQSLLILTFHGIGAPRRPFRPREESFWVEPPFFETVLDDVKGRTDALLTFDDGNASDYEVALPALQARGMKAHFYIVSDFIGQPGFISEAKLKEMHAAGMIIGNHGKRHCSWRGLTARELQEELVEARDRLEDIISDNVRFAACPDGRYDRRVLKHLRACGYERVYTSDRGWTHAGAWLQSRNSVFRDRDWEETQREFRAAWFDWRTALRFCKRTIKRCR